MSDEQIYLDYAATTPLLPEAMEAMLPYFQANFGNPSSVHSWGQKAEAAVAQSRQAVAEVFHCSPAEVVFTSCGTESDNLALRGLAHGMRQARNANHILISSVEHPAVDRTAQDLANRYGFELERLPVDEFGRVLPEQVARALRPETAVVSVIYANNEIGTVNPIAEIGEICREHDIPFHTDAVQAAGKLSLDIRHLHVDSLSLSGHKFYGPKGVGVLYLRSGRMVLPSQTGGGQEFGLRSGTHNVPLIVGLATALQLADGERRSECERLLPLCEALIESILREIPNIRLTGHPHDRLPNHCSFVIEGLESNELLAALDLEGFACSSSSACKTGDPEPSHVLDALGIPADLARGSLRVTLGHNTSSGQIERLIDKLPILVEQLRRTEEPT